MNFLREYLFVFVYILNVFVWFWLVRFCCFFKMVDEGSWKCGLEVVENSDEDEEDDMIGFMLVFFFK